MITPDFVLESDHASCQNSCTLHHDHRLLGEEAGAQNQFALHHSSLNRLCYCRRPIILVIILA
jgi:hypothetical protein